MHNLAMYGLVLLNSWVWTWNLLQLSIITGAI
jgi:hypothetical protein